MSFQYEKVGVGRVSSVMVLNSVLFSNDMFAVVVVIVVCYLLWTSKLLKTLITDTHIYIYILHWVLKVWDFKIIFIIYYYT